MSIDQAVEIATNRAFIQHSEGLVADRFEICAACGKQGVYNGEEWLDETLGTYVEDDGQGTQWLAGDSLPEADDTPMGWVCSDVCRCQAMYAQATMRDKEALDKVLDACRVLSEYGQRVESLLTDKLGTCPAGSLIEGAVDFLRIVGEAEWTER